MDSPRLTKVTVSKMVLRQLKLTKNLLLRRQLHMSNIIMNHPLLVVVHLLLVEQTSNKPQTQ